MTAARFLLTLSFPGLLLGCSTASKTVSTTGKVALGTVKTAGAVAGKTVTTTGKVAGTAVSATGTVVKATAGGAAGIVKTAFVTFKDTATGMVKQVPWVEGMKVYAAGKTAQVDMSLKAFQIMRGSQVIKSDWGKIKSGAPEPELRPGDVIEVGRALNRS